MILIGEKKKELQASRLEMIIILKNDKASYMFKIVGREKNQPESNTLS
jgi:hypothetical protein